MENPYFEQHEGMIARKISEELANEAYDSNGETAEYSVNFDWEHDSLTFEVNGKVKFDITYSRPADRENPAEEDHADNGYFEGEVSIADSGESLFYSEKQGIDVTF